MGLSRAVEALPKRGKTFRKRRGTPVGPAGGGTAGDDDSVGF